MIYLPLPSVVSFIQIISSVIILLVLMACGVKIDKLEWPKVKAYGLYIIAFVTSIFANMKALQHSNVETVIVFRACTPLAVSIIDYLFMGRLWPSTRASLSLTVVFCGAVVYCISDSQFAMNGIGAYYWVTVYFLLITFEMTYGKKLTSSVKMDSVWGPVLYCNLLAAFPMFCLGYFAGDFDNAVDTVLNLPTKGTMVLLFSCVAGTLIGYVSLYCMCSSSIC
jgi:GDP-mannose transporter